MPYSPTLLVVACLATPVAGSAQTATAPAPLPESPPTFRLFKDAPREPGVDWIGSIKSPNWWEPPASGSEVPRWRIGHSVALKTAGGLVWSAGFFGRRGDPLPMYLSGGDKRSSGGHSLTGPGTYRVQWDATFGVSAPLWTGPRVKINAIGELFVPLTSPRAPADPSATFLTSRTLRFGIVTSF